MGSFIGSILVKSLVVAPNIQKGIDIKKTNEKNLSDDLFSDTLLSTLSLYFKVLLTEKAAYLPDKFAE